MNMAWWKLIVLVLTGGIISQLTETCEYCNQTIQYHDEDRMACFDRCGAYNELRCTVDEICSSTVPYGARVQPPACLNRCPMLCKNGSYCHHDHHKCLPCSSLCSAYDKSACRVFCYDFFKALPSRFADPRDCESNQYFDNDRIVCLDQCGADNETKCQVDQFCSSRITWSMHYDPPVCVSHCNQLCDGDTYCDHISHSCMTCDTLCSGANKQACRIHCYEMFLTMTGTTTSTPDISVISEETTSAMVQHATACQQDCGWKPSVILITISCVGHALFLLIIIGHLYRCIRSTKDTGNSSSTDGTCSESPMVTDALTSEVLDTNII